MERAICLGQVHFIISVTASCVSMEKCLVTNFSYLFNPRMIRGLIGVTPVSDGQGRRASRERSLRSSTAYCFARKIKSP